MRGRHTVLASRAAWRAGGPLTKAAIRIGGEQRPALLTSHATSTRPMSEEPSKAAADAQVGVRLRLPGWQIKGRLCAATGMGGETSPAAAP
ncbi:hypothetical protein GCM10010378_45770 [Streptomyces viridochromogenes]